MSPEKNALVIIQARIESTRLPGKAMLELGGKPLLAHVIERAQAIRGVKRVVLATGDTPENRVLLDLASSMGAGSFAGSLDDVLERYFKAAELFPGDPIIRITGDNPFTDPWQASSTLDYYYEKKADYAVAEGLPLGTGVEIVSRMALAEAHLRGRESYQREHVTPYIREHSEIFKSVRRHAAILGAGENYRLTIDTPEDLEVARHIVAGANEKGIIPLERIISFLRIHPEIAEINREIAQRPMTHASK